MRENYEIDQRLIDSHNAWAESIPDEIVIEIGKLVMSFSQLDLYLIDAIGGRIWSGQESDYSRTVRVVADLTFQERANLFRSLGRSSVEPEQLELDEIIHIQLSAAAKSRNNVVHAWYLANSRNSDIMMFFGGRTAPGSDWGYRMRRIKLTVELIRDARADVVNAIAMIANSTYSTELSEQ